MVAFNESGAIDFGMDNSSCNGTFNISDPYCGSAPMETMPIPPWVFTMVQVLYAIVCIVGLSGNTLVIYVVVRFSKMQTVTNLYIVNLAIADELFLVGVPFLISTMNLGYWPFGSIACKAYYTSTAVNQITSSIFLLIMSADRYLAVCHPIRAPKWRTPLIAKVVAIVAWSLSAVIMIPIYMYANVDIIDNKTNCNIFWPGQTQSDSKIFIWYSFGFGFGIPSTLIIVFYVLVILRLRTLGPKRRTHQTNNSKAVTIESACQRARDRKRSHRKVTKLVLTVITVYFVCWFPFWITQIDLSYTPTSAQHSASKLMMYLLAGCLSYSNSAMNPILYAFLSDNFKKSFLKACICANRKDANAVLHNENSIFPRAHKMSQRDHNRKAGGGGMSTSKSNEVMIPKIEGHHHHDSDEEDQATMSKDSRQLTSRSGFSSDVSKVTQETFVQDGVQMTAL